MGQERPRRLSKAYQGSEWSGDRPLVIAEPEDVENLRTDWTEPRVDRLRDGQETTAAAAAVVVTNLHVRVVLQGLTTSLAHQPGKARDSLIAHGQTALLGGLELTSTANNDADVAVVLGVLGSSKDGDEEDLSVAPLLSGLARRLNAIGVTTLTLSVQQGDRALTSKEVGEDGAGGKNVRGLGVHYLYLPISCLQL